MPAPNPGHSILSLQGKIPDEDFSLLVSPDLTASLLEHSGEAGVIVINKSGKIIYLSKRAQNLLGVPAASLLGADYATSIVVFDNNGKEIPVQKRLVWQALYTPDYKRLTPFFCYLGQDLTERMQVAMTARQVLSGGKVAAVLLQVREVKRVLNVDEMKSLFISFAAHQLKTPSSIVKGFLELLIKEGEGAFSKGQWENIQSAYSATETLIELTKALLNLTKLEGGMIEPKLAPINPAELVQDRIKARQMLAKVKGIQTSVISNKPGGYFETDPIILSEVFDILYNNAIKFSPENGRITVVLQLAEAGATISVADQGEGVSPEKQEKLFTTTFKSDPASSGHGLGLVIAKKYLALLKGTIGVESKPGQGATFTFFIPKYL